MKTYKCPGCQKRAKKLGRCRNMSFKHCRECHFGKKDGSTLVICGPSEWK